MGNWVLVILGCILVICWVALIFSNEKSLSEGMLGHDAIKIGHRISGLVSNTQRELIEEEQEEIEADDVHDIKDLSARVSPPQALPPPEMSEIIKNMTIFLGTLNKKYIHIKKEQKNPVDIWNIYFELAEKMLIPLDLQYKGSTIYPVRSDDSVFVSMASYRDEYCPETLKSMYLKAEHPDKVFTGLVLQNCLSHCRTGVLDHAGTIKDTEPDIDCYKVFCESDEGKRHCAEGRVRLLFINETESLGPAQGRYFASKLWYGEQWFMQIDAHCTFAKGWDTEMIEEYNSCPTKNPKRILTTYPPSPDDPNWEHQKGLRICDPLFASSDIESQIVRLEGSMQFDHEDKGPRFAPFIAAGFFFTHSSFLADIPFDPLMPFVFMGEEILLSSRFWTNGWDIFSPSKNVLTHVYVRRHRPKFWESVGRLFKMPGEIYNPVQLKIIDRVKNILGYPETSDEIIYPSTLTAYKELYGIGYKRKMEDFLDMVGINLQTKRITLPDWCHKGEKPKQVD